MGTRATLPRLAPFNRAPVVVRGVVLGTECTPGVSCRTVGGYVAPPTAPAAKGVWSRLLVGIGRSCTGGCGDTYVWRERAGGFLVYGVNTHFH